MDGSVVMKQQQDNAIERARKVFASGLTKDVKFRRTQLKALKALLNDNKEAIFEAVKGDLEKPEFETSLHELLLLENDIHEFLGELEKHDKPEHKTKGIMTFFDSVYVKKEPLGVVLVMGAWNYPVMLSLAPVAGAIAAGNACILKPSEQAACFAQLIAELFPKYLHPDCYHVINCGPEGSAMLLRNHKFDHIFYTGSTNGARAVYEAAAKHLTPVVLELGGKSPVYIDEKCCDKEALWLRLFWGKFINSGQTCIAPDYVLCSAKTQAKARKYFNKTIEKFYNANASTSGNFSRIVNAHHYERIKSLVKECRLMLGGQLHPDSLRVEPAIVTDVSMDDPIMQEEIFGPILPFVTVKNEDEAISIINSRPKPLALYVFTESSQIVDKFERQTSSGALLVNDTILHIAVESLPFGGVGESGIGKYHGKYSLDVFSNTKAVLKRNFNPLLEWLGSHRYPPYNDTNHMIRENTTTKFVYHTPNDNNNQAREPYNRGHRESGLLANYSHQSPRQNYAVLDSSSSTNNKSRRPRMNNNVYHHHNHDLYQPHYSSHVSSTNRQFGNQFQPSHIDYDHVQPMYDNQLRSSFAMHDQRDDNQHALKSLYQAPYESSSIEQPLSAPANVYTQNVVRSKLPEPGIVREQRNGRQVQSRIIYSNAPTALSINDTLKFAVTPESAGRANQGLTSLGPGLAIVNATPTTTPTDINDDSTTTTDNGDGGDDEAESGDSSEPSAEDGDENVKVDERSDDISYNEVEDESRDNSSSPPRRSAHTDNMDKEQLMRRTGDDDDDQSNDYDDNQQQHQSEDDDSATKVRIIEGNKIGLKHQSSSNQKQSPPVNSKQSNKKDKNLHRHNLTESMVSKRWNDESPQMARRQTGTESDNELDDEDSIPFLELDKKSSPFANIILGRFKRDIQTVFDDDEMVPSIDARSDERPNVNSIHSDPDARGLSKDATDIQIRFEPELQPLAISTINAPQAPIYDYRYPNGVRRRRVTPSRVTQAQIYGDVAQPKYEIAGHGQKQYDQSSPTEHHSIKSKSGQSKMKRSHKKKSSKAIKRGDMKHKKYGKQSSQHKKGKEFKGVKMGKKAIKGHGRQGGKKGLKFYKDKGYKKRGFKNRYHKEESGDHKTYFDEFRDKDFKKKYKKFDDNYDYKQTKKWLGKNSEKKKKMKNHGEKHKKSSKGKWKKDQKSSSKKKSEYSKSGHGSKLKKT
ncbi:Aldehyde dehydrogenase family 3 member B1 [Fragariocoptes setiger]|uniref:Aldehyde dehydrogenase family 3 member B1 n=1 Tax=Fragariocoptes setiger TaxID=1670756 RepID=A0ABQ7S7H8_9ACAR|nr:Aldehyde dehydrogenase family 3 member B1 [Fragariocoptes setiger]